MHLYSNEFLPSVFWLCSINMVFFLNNQLTIAQTKERKDTPCTIIKSFLNIVHKLTQNDKISYRLKKSVDANVQCTCLSLRRCAMALIPPIGGGKYQMKNIRDLASLPPNLSSSYSVIVKFLQPQIRSVIECRIGLTIKVY